MAHYNTVFNQLLNMLPRHRFESSVSEYQGDYYTKHFTSWNQLLVNLYAQASSKDSLRDIETGLKVQQNNWYHLGLKSAARSTISYANGRRDYRIYEDTFYQTLDKCKDVTPKHRFKFKNPLYTLDATVIDLCLSLFPWAKFRKQKGGLKLHFLLDYRGQIPSFLVITDAKQHEMKIARSLSLPLSWDSILIVDKAYIDFKWLWGLHNKGIYFVSRAKSNIKYRVIGQLPANKKKGIISDEEIELTGYYSKQKYPGKLRLTTYYDKETKKTYKFLTNNFKLAAYTITQIYKARWDIELFFKWIKQNLKIKTFLGTSKNAVLTQIWTAMTYYLLLAYIKYQSKYKNSLLYFTRIIRESLFRRLDIIDLLNLSLIKLQKLKEPSYQLALF